MYFFNRKPITQKRHPTEIAVSMQQHKYMYTLIIFPTTFHCQGKNKSAVKFQSMSEMFHVSILSTNEKRPYSSVVGTIPTGLRSHSWHHSSNSTWAYGRSPCNSQSAPRLGRTDFLLQSQLVKTAKLKTCRWKCHYKQQSWQNAQTPDILAGYLSEPIIMHPTACFVSSECDVTHYGGHRRTKLNADVIFHIIAP